LLKDLDKSKNRISILEEENSNQKKKIFEQNKTMQEIQNNLDKQILDNKTLN
jgi:uncharacterized coiled-coil protein SlyX